MLAGRAEQVVGIDVAEVALDQARALSVRHANICYETGDITQLAALRQGPFDLIMITDVLYYLSLTEPLLKSIRSSIEALLASDGLLLLSHHSFFGLDTASRQTRWIHDCFGWKTKLELVREQWHPFYLTTVLRHSALNRLEPLRE